MRTFVIVPSDVRNLPSDATIRNRTNEALARIAQFYDDKAGLEMGYDPATVLHSARDSAWFSQPLGARARVGGQAIKTPIEEPWDPYRDRRRNGVQAAAAPPAVDQGRIETYLNEAGYGLVKDGWVTLVIAATSLGGGYAGANIWPLRLHLRHTPNSGPDAGPPQSSWCVVSQWVLEVVLTGQDSVSCKNEMGSNFWACPANVGMGTLVHELGHAFGLPHPCDGWYGDNWEYTSNICDGLIMQSHWNYPSAGFSENEKAILRLNPVFESDPGTDCANGFTMTVDARQGWQSHPVQWREGSWHSYEVTAGEWTHWRGGRPYNPGTGENYICAEHMPVNQCGEPLGTFNHGALLTRVENAFGAGPPAGVGQQRTLQIRPTSGSIDPNRFATRVALRINDADGGLGDNDGVLTVRICDVPEPRAGSARRAATEVLQAPATRQAARAEARESSQEELAPTPTPTP